MQCVAAITEPRVHPSVMRPYICVIFNEPLIFSSMPHFGQSDRFHTASEGEREDGEQASGGQREGREDGEERRGEQRRMRRERRGEGGKGEGQARSHISGHLI